MRAADSAAIPCHTLQTLPQDPHLKDELGKHQHLLLKDKVCVIVGAASLRGIGYATVGTGMLDGKLTAEKQAEILAGIPLQRAGLSADVAGVCLFLASALAAYVTGATIDVNGGSHIH